MFCTTWFAAFRKILSSVSCGKKERTLRFFLKNKTNQIFFFNYPIRFFFSKSIPRLIIPTIVSFLLIKKTIKLKIFFLAIRKSRLFIWPVRRLGDPDWASDGSRSRRAGRRGRCWSGERRGTIVTAQVTVIKREIEKRSRQRLSWRKFENMKLSIIAASLWKGSRFFLLRKLSEIIREK